MTTTESKSTERRVWPEAAAAAARASIAMRKKNGRDIPQWILDVAEGKPLPKGFKQDPATGEQIAP